MPLLSSHPGPRLALAFFTIFLIVGMYMPYWPIWLDELGFSETQIGLLLGMGSWVRIVAGPIAGAHADRQGATTRLLRRLAFGLVVAYCGFLGARSFGAVFFVALVSALAFSPVMGLLDSLAVLAARRGEIAYAPVRLWGSVAFIVASVGLGIVLEGRSSMTIVWALIVAAGLFFVATLGLPPDLREPVETSASRWSGWADLFRRADFVLFLLATSFLQASHCLYYGFGSLYWAELGFSEGQIGTMWSVGVVAEILLFTFAGRIARLFKIRPHSWLIVAALGGLLRWPGLAFAESLVPVFALQALHGLTFGALHLGAMGWLGEAVPASKTATATSLYTAVAMGIAMGGGLLAAGVLFEAFSGRAFLFMAVSSLGGGLCAWALQQGRGDPRA